MDSKTCRACGETKPVDSFFIQRATKDGLCPYCRSCCAERKRNSKDGTKAALARRKERLLARSVMPEVDSKRCPKCGEVRPGSAFTKCRSNVDGLQSRCKACAKTYSLENADKVKANSDAWYQANKARRAATGLAWKEANAERLSASRLRYRTENRDKVNAAIKAWNEKNREYRAAYVSAWQKANGPRCAAKARRYRQRHPIDPTVRAKQNKAWRLANPIKTRVLSCIKRARKRAALGTHTAQQIIDLAVRQKHKCASCAVSIKQGYHADHIMPLVRGGSNDIKNIQLLCPPCNLRKHAKHPLDWARENGRLL